MENPTSNDLLVVFLKYLVATQDDTLLQHWLSVLYDHKVELFESVSTLMRILLTQPLHITFDTSGSCMHLYASRSPFVVVPSNSLDEKSRQIFRALYIKRHAFSEKYCKQLALYVDFTPLIQRLFALLLLSSPPGAFVSTFEMLQLILQRFELVHWTPNLLKLRNILKHADVFYKHDG